MDRSTLFFAIMALGGWGLGSFIAKLATNRIGALSVAFDLVGYAIAAGVYSLFIFKPSSIFTTDKIGAMLAFVAGVVGSFGGIAFYYLMAKKDASVVVPLTSLYPALTVLLAVIFLRENLTLVKMIGMLFSLAAIVLLSM